MSDIFLISDLHFGHRNILKFEEPRKKFSCTEEFDEHIVEVWNQKVKNNDRVIVAGDVCWNTAALETLDRLNGSKILVMGNHDKFQSETYLKYFRKICGCLYLEKNVVTHIPIHPSQFPRFDRNLHGHLHTQRVLLDDGSIDKRYINVSCEQMPNLAPMEYSEILEYFK